MANMNGQRRTARAAERSFPEAGGCELAHLIRALGDLEIFQRDRGKHHSDRPGHMLTDPTMTPPRIVRLASQAVIHGTTRASASEHVGLHTFRHSADNDRNTLMPPSNVRNGSKADISSSHKTLSYSPHSMFLYGS